ncbi:MAG: hypothetical protein JWM20_104 [Patescibacteria group bacterium]|nr:hypothetical protein [Patescibacteria group bacterium]
MGHKQLSIEKKYANQRRLFFFFLIMVGVGEIAGIAGIITKKIGGNDFMIGNFIAGFLTVALMVAFIMDIGSTDKKENS